MIALSMCQLVKHTLLLPQPVAPLRIRYSVFSNYFLVCLFVLLAENKIASLQLEFFIFCQ